MVNERYDDKFEGHEEGEYHFSDDQANYELENENSSAKDGTVVAAMPKESIAEKLKNHRRIVVGIVIFIVLLGIVYKLVMPSSTAPTTDFSQQGSSTTTTKITTTKVTAPVTTQPANPVVQQPVVTQPTTSAPAMTTTTTATQVTQPAMPEQQAVSAPAAPAVMPQQQQPVTTTEAKSALDRIATLEQQNSEMMSLMQTQYTQKLADAEAQNTELRTQVQELTSRVSSMEVAFKQLTKILRNANGPATNNSYASAPRPMRAAAPRLAYTVQAIIPGRAWLKSDSGETVTVAEGDALRGVGRITKIDPYDGIVNIDTGNKVVTLSYGASGD